MRAGVLGFLEGAASSYAALLRTGEERAQHLLPPPAHNTHTHREREIHTHTLQQGNPKRVFVLLFPEIQTQTLMRRKCGKPRPASALQAEGMALPASGLLALIRTNSKLRFPLRFSDKTSERHKRGLCYSQRDDGGDEK